MHRIKVGSNLPCMSTDNTSINMRLHQDDSNLQFEVVMLEMEPGLFIRGWDVGNLGQGEFPCREEGKKAK